MKCILKFVFPLSLFASCTGNKVIKYLTDLEQANIKGHVTKLITETYEIDSTGQIIKAESETIEYFDELGYTTTDTTRNFADKNEIVNSLKFNNNGSLSSLSTFENGRKQSEMLLKYDNDKCISMNIYDANDKLESYYKNIFQTKYGLLLSLDSYDANGKFLMSYANEYDSIYQIKAIAKDSSGMLKSEINIHLTDKKYEENVVEVTYFKDSIDRKSLFYQYKKWDEAGNWTERTVLDDKGNIIKTVKRIFSYR
ncbi:MAG: hypothetical protein WBP16_17365 [Ferruginibacter sp.]